MDDKAPLKPHLGCKSPNSIITCCIYLFCFFGRVPPTLTVSALPILQQTSKVNQYCFGPIRSNTGIQFISESLKLSLDLAATSLSNITSGGPGQVLPPASCPSFIYLQRILSDSNIISTIY